MVHPPLSTWRDKPFSILAVTSAGAQEPFWPCSRSVTWKFILSARALVGRLNVSCSWARASLSSEFATGDNLTIHLCDARPKPDSRKPPN